MIKLDVYDKKILELLIQNSRGSLNAVAKKVRLSRQNVDYRIKRFVEQGLIKEFNTIIDEKKLGLVHYVVFLELVNLQEDTERGILNYLRESKHASWIGAPAGKWSLTFDIIISEKENLNKIINKLMNKFEKFIGEYTILKLEDGNYFAAKLLGVIKKKEFGIQSDKKVELDNKDKQILYLLNNDSWISLVEISEKVKLTPNGIQKRIKNLERNNVVLGYTISLDWKQLGYEWYGLQLKLTKFGEDIHKRLIDFFANNKRVIFYYKYLGGVWDYDFGVIVRNSEELREFINEFRKYFSTIAKISDVFITLEETSGYKLPKGVFD